MVFEMKPGGRLYEDAGDGNGLVWYQVIALDAPNTITMSGFIAPPFGGPATSLLRIVFSAQGKSATVMELTDSTFGCLEDSTTREGWRQLFEGGLKAWIERNVESDTWMLGQDWFRREWQHELPAPFL